MTDRTAGIIWAVAAALALVLLILAAREHIRPEWLATVAAVLLPSPLTRKGATRMQILNLIRTILLVVGLAVALTEDVLGPGSGQEKKARAVAELSTRLPDALRSAGVPDAVVTFICQESILGLAVDLVVSAMNAAGQLAKPAAA